MSKSIALVLTKPPFSDQSGQEALDMAMVLGTFEIPTAIFFIGESVSQFNQIKPDMIETKNFVKGYAALPFYDVEDLFVSDTSLSEHKVDQQTLPDHLTVLGPGELSNTLLNYDSVVRF